MLHDDTLYKYMQQEQFEKLIPLDIHFIGNQGEHLQAWTLHFQNLDEDQMYVEVKHLINQLIIAQMADETRLALLYEVAKVSQLLLSKLRLQYCNQVGLLNTTQHAALDKVLSIYYMSIMVYYNVWQRLSSQLGVETQKTSPALLRRFTKPTATTQDLVKRCVYTIIVILKQALLEKHLGYRNDTQVIWHYLHACYSFSRTYDWEHYCFDLSDLFHYTGMMDIQSIYYQCLLADIIVPASYRRYDLLHYQMRLVEWTKYMRVTSDPDDKPFLFVNLNSDVGVQTLHPDMAYNPFAPDVSSLFIDIAPLIQNITLVAQYEPNSNDDNTRQKERLLHKRLAKLALPNLYTKIKPPPLFTPTHEPYYITLGFHAIHYLLSGKISLANLIHSHLLPEPLRPMSHTDQSLIKPSRIMLTGTYQQQSQLTWHDNLPAQQTPITGNRLPQASLVNQFQVNSLIAMLDEATLSDRHAKKNWQLGQILSLKQYLPPPSEDNLTLNQRIQQYPSSQDNTDDMNTTQISVKMLGEGIVPCGVRIINPESRLPRFMPALIIPRNPKHPSSQTSLMMVRFGYQVNDKLIIRIDSKEVKIRLNELIEITDDIENYTFVRI